MNRKYGEYKNILCKYGEHMKVKIKKRQLVVFMLVMSMIAEIANGLMIQNGISENGVIGYIYRGCLIVLSIIIIINTRDFFGRTVLCLIFFLVAFIIHIIFWNAQVTEVISIIKYALFPCTLFAVEVLYRKKIISENDFAKCLVASGVICSTSLIIARILGLGVNTYEGVTGYKGLFNSVNTITFVLIILISLTYVIAKENDQIRMYILIIIELGCLILIGTKSGIVLIACIIALYTMSNHGDNKVKISVKKILLIVFFILCCIVFVIKFNTQINEIVSRQYEFKGRSDSLYTYLVSGRNILLHTANQKYAQDCSILTMLFGVGEIRLSSYIGKLLEMDLFDFFYAWGIGGVLATYGLTLWYVLYLRKTRKFDKKQTRLLWSIYFILTIYSILGGHVYGEPFSEVYFVLALNFPVFLNGNIT